MSENGGLFGGQLGPGRVGSHRVQGWSKSALRSFRICIKRHLLEEEDQVTCEERVFLGAKRYSILSKMFPLNAIPLQQHPAVPDFASPKPEPVRVDPHSKVPALETCMTGLFTLLFVHCVEKYSAGFPPALQHQFSACCAKQYVLHTVAAVHNHQFWHQLHVF